MLAALEIVKPEERNAATRGLGEDVPRDVFRFVPLVFDRFAFLFLVGRVEVIFRLGVVDGVEGNSVGHLPVEEVADDGAGTHAFGVTHAIKRDSVLARGAFVFAIAILFVI